MTYQQKWTPSLIALPVAFATLLMVMGAASLGPASIDGPTATADTTEKDTVEVAITEGSMEAPSSVEAGEVTFVVSNQGQQAHGFALSGQGTPQVEEQLAAGQRTTVNAELEAGSYTAYCPIEGHRERESAEIEVEDGTGIDGE